MSRPLRIEAGVYDVCALQITMSEDAWVQWSAVSERLELMQDVLIRGLIRSNKEAKS